MQSAFVEGVGVEFTMKSTIMANHDATPTISESDTDCISTPAFESNKQGDLTIIGSHAHHEKNSRVQAQRHDDDYNGGTRDTACYHRRRV